MKFLFSELFWKPIFIFGVLVMIPCLFPYETKAQDSNLSHLGTYGKTSTFCGGGPLQQNPTTIPQIGCFLLSAGRSATATISTHRIEVSVDNAGNERFKADGTLITRNFDTPTHTNLFYVNDASSGFAFCQGQTDQMKLPRCPSDITVFSRNPDKSVLFMVSKCMPPDYNSCVTTQENWDYEMSRKH